MFVIAIPMSVSRLEFIFITSCNWLFEASVTCVYLFGLKRSNSRLVSWGSVDERPADDFVGKMDHKTGTTEGRKRHWYISKMDGWWIFSCRNLKEAWYNWILLRRRPSDRCVIQRPGSIVWRWGLLLWYKDEPIFSLLHKGSCVVYFRR